METSLVLTVIGEDKPGLVETVSQVVSDHGGNWVESSMARLAGKFAGIAHVTIPTENADALRTALAELDSQGLKVVVEQSDATPVETGFRFMKLDLVGGDRVGIVHDVSQALAHRNINVEDLQTECSSAPMSGKLIFRATAKLGVPPQVDLNELHNAIETLANDLIVDISLDEFSA